MKHLFAKANVEVLAQFAWSRTLLAFDYDGTLAPIVTDPAKAQMRATTRSLLCAVTRRYPCVVISGRAQKDAQPFLRGVRLAAIVGNHGIEPWNRSKRLLREIERWRPILASKLAVLSGVQIENKDYSLAVHYRGSRQKKKARREILAAVLSLGPVRIIGGKQVVNILPPDAPHKGMALERVRARLGCDTAIYVGDDTTDEDVFSLDQPGQLLSIRVGKKADSQAAYYIKSQREIDRLLRRLIAYRDSRAARGSG